MHPFSKYPSTLKMVAAGSLKTVVRIYQNTQCDVTKDISLQDVSNYAMGILAGYVNLGPLPKIVYIINKYINIYVSGIGRTKCRIV